MSENLVKGILEIRPEGNGFLRSPYKNFNPHPLDPEISSELINELNLREGLDISAKVEEKKKKLKVLSVEKINNCSIKEYHNIKDYKKGISIDPEEQLMMAYDSKDFTGRIIDLIAPIAKGQRGMVISPSKAGKTTILKHIAKSVLVNNPEVKVFILLVDERPEEITDFSRSLPRAKVFHSSVDKSTKNHMRISRLVMNMATRMAEFGQDSMIVMDSLTRLARASNKETESGNRIISGGLGIKAMELPRQYLGRARNIEDSGSITIIASILVDTGSRMDEVIFNEFKGTCNMDLVLSRECAEQRLFPAINILESATRKEEKILSEKQIEKSYKLRRKISNATVTDALRDALVFLGKRS